MGVDMGESRGETGDQCVQNTLYVIFKEIIKVLLRKKQKLIRDHVFNFVHLYHLHSSLT